MSEPCGEHAGTCASVRVWVNHVPGFTAAQGHHLQPHHRSAGDGSIPNQQEVRRVRDGRGEWGASTAEGGSEIVSSPSVCPSPTPPPPHLFLVLARQSGAFLFPPRRVNSISPHLQCFVLLLLTTWWIQARGDIFNSSIQVSQSLIFFPLETATVAAFPLQFSTK